MYSTIKSEEEMLRIQVYSLPKAGAPNLRKPGEVKTVRELDKERSQIQDSSRSKVDTFPLISKMGMNLEDRQNSLARVESGFSLKDLQDASSSIRGRPKHLEVLQGRTQRLRFVKRGFQPLQSVSLPFLKSAQRRSTILN